jgi:hypothetical protein
MRPRWSRPDPSDDHPPISQLLARKPWLLPRLYTGEIPDEV